MVLLKFNVFVPGGNGFVNVPEAGIPIDVTTEHHVTGVRLVVRREAGR